MSGAEPRGAPGTRRPRILVVDDEAVIAVDLEARLGRLGYEVVGLASSGEEARRLAESTLPDLVLMDIRIQGPVDGTETARELRARWGIPIVYLTAYADDETLARANLAEPFGYVVKPFDDRDLATAVGVALLRHRLERELRASEARYRNLFERSLAGMFVTLDDGRVLDCNDAFARILGYASREEVLARNTREFYVEPAEPERLLLGLRCVRAAPNLELRFRRKDGGQIWVLMNVARIDDGLETRFEGQIVDVTDHRRAEAFLREREALASAIALASATAHEINNPLMALMGRLELVLGRAGADPAVLRQVEQALDAARRIQDTVRRMLQITRFEYDALPSVPMLDIPKSAPDPE